VHQAKGLEFPVVVLWDACADLASPGVSDAFVVDRTGASWALGLDGLEWEEPEDGDVAGREKRYLDAERLRLVYVAATRARDLLVLPVAGDRDPRWITGRLATGAPAELVEVLAPYVPWQEPVWATEVGAPAPRPLGDASALALEVAGAWRGAVEEAARPRFAPAAVSSEAHAAVEALEREDEAGSARKWRESRFGRVFGDTVHLAIGLGLRDPALAPEAAVARAAAATGLAEHHAEAAEDVARAVAALEKAGLRRAPGPDLQLVYPVALARDGRLLVGYVDLLAAEAGGLVVVDFKTDAPPAGDVAATHPAYVEQVRSYARIVEDLGLAQPGSVRPGLLFTAEAEIRWVRR
jgi:ATP-dependent helicase/nuclease subunit A